MKFATVPGGSCHLFAIEICVVTSEIRDRYRWCWLSLFETYETNQGVHSSHIAANQTFFLKGTY